MSVIIVDFNRYYGGEAEQQGMAPAPEMPQHFPQFHPQSDEGDEDEDEDEEDDGIHRKSETGKGRGEERGRKER